MLLWATRRIGRADEGGEGRRRSSTRRETSTEPRRLLRHRRDARRPARLTDMRPQVGAVRVVAGRPARELHQRQGRQAAGGAVPAGELREGQVVSDDREHLREAVADGEPRSRAPTRERLQPVGLHEQRLRGAASRTSCTSVNDPGHVGGVVHGAGGQGGDRHRHRRSEAGRDHGHSWGGYQTAFLDHADRHLRRGGRRRAADQHDQHVFARSTRTRGGTNGAIFESSQGRFKGGYWDNWDAYYRNSPVFFAKNVKTPLMILHNDKDGAVDFTQGVEYFNTLRRLGEAGGHARVRRREPRPRAAGRTSGTTPCA